MSASNLTKTSFNERRCFRAKPDEEESSLGNEADLVMSLSQKDILIPTAASQQQQLEPLLKHNTNDTSTQNSVSAAAAVAVAHHHHSLSSIQHLQNLHTQHHSTIFNNNHSTPFSVTDILSPIEESYRKLEINGNPPSPFRSNSSGSSINSPGAISTSTMANPYAMGSLYHSPGVQSYCGPTDNLSLAGHYTDMRGSASWYGSTANDPRFAISRLMSSSASGSMGHMGNMTGLAACSVNDAKPLQFPLAQRRKRRVLFTQAQSASSPRRVAVPVLVKDGKPCPGANNAVQPQTLNNSSTTSGNNSNNSNGNVNGVTGTAAVTANVPSVLNLIPGDTPNSHSPDTSSSLIASYGGTVGGSNASMLQQPCNNALMSNSLAMAYRNQNNFISNGHQQQCGGYLPLQGRAW
ncbi:uncharacterized protein LOC135439720 isoform X4 [Drosophila montana]|uniref:uncharacterized protein LOC135439720 isoform X4 n=1 Tax=Drosophila montana TaxID=40370 RepID=UPI00313CB896